jgi:hypothetical protein
MSSNWRRIEAETDDSGRLPSAWPFFGRTVAKRGLEHDQTSPIEGLDPPNRRSFKGSGKRG